MMATMPRKTIFCLYLLICSVGLPAQRMDDSLRILFWNTENLFHPDDDAGSGDDPFTPGGIRKWTYFRYHTKISQLAKVILACGGWNSPDAICLCEIENEKVLRDIINHPLLRKLNYSFIHRDSPDHRGMDVAILYRTEVLDCIDTAWIKIMNRRDEVLPTREILSVIMSDKNDTIIVMMNHWSSKYGGAIESEEKRMLEARTLSKAVDSLLKIHPHSTLIIGGDLNESRQSPAVSSLSASTNLHYLAARGEARSYKYQGKWESIDHVLISENAISQRFCLKIISASYLLEKDEKYTGEMPFRTYRGYAYNGGVSDHLPLLLTFRADPG